MKEKILESYVGAKIRVENFKEKKIKPFLQNERGDIVQTTIIIAILALLAFFVLSNLRGPIKDAFSNIEEQLEDAGTKQ